MKRLSASSGFPTNARPGHIASLHALAAICLTLCSLATLAQNNSIDDGDFDGVDWFDDNCLWFANALQDDSDGDGIGNLCDADFNNDCIVNTLDLGLFNTAFFTTGNTQFDLNSDGLVNPIDLGILRLRFFSPPAPSGLADICDGIGPYGVDIFVRGSWEPNFDTSPEDRMSHVGDGVHTVVRPLDGATYRFKTGAEDFDDFTANCNPAVDGTPAVLGKAMPFECGTNVAAARLDLRLEPDATDYRFVLEAGANPAHAMMTVLYAGPRPAPAPGDTQPPQFAGSLMIEPPTQPISGDVSITAPVTDNNAVSEVQFFVDGQLIWADFTSPFQAPWDTLGIDNGQHVVTATATDANGYQTMSDPLIVGVENSVPGPIGVPMFVRGAFVDDATQQFNTDHPLQFTSAGRYQAVVLIDRTATPPTEFFINFKIADTGWTDGTNCGGAPGAPPTLVLDQSQELVCSADGGGQPPVHVPLNLLGQPQPADYLFLLDASAWPAPPTVTVTLAP